MFNPYKTKCSVVRIWAFLLVLFNVVQLNVHANDFNRSSKASYFRSGDFLFRTIDFADLSGTVNLQPPGVPDLTHPDTKLEVFQNYATADGFQKNIVRVRLVDSDGNPVIGKDVNIIIADGSMGVAPVIVTDASGYAYVSLSSYSMGDVSITARVDGQLIPNGSPAILTFIAGPPDVLNQQTTLSVVHTGAIANGTDENIVAAQLFDTNGNPVANETVTFGFTGFATADWVSGNTAVTDANGYAEIRMTNIYSGPVSVVASVGGVGITNGSPAIVTFVADDPDVNGPYTFMDVVIDGAPADGTSTNMVYVHVGDANGNSVEGVAVVFTIVSGTGQFVGSTSVLTDEFGEAVIELTSTVAGFVQVAATMNGIPIIQGAPAEVEFTADDPDFNHPDTRLEVVTSGAVADNVDQNTVKAILKDAAGNPVPNYLVQFTISEGTGQLLASGNAFTDANGEAVINIISTVAGEVKITASSYGDPITNGSPATVIFVAGDPDPSYPGTRLEVITNNATANGTAQNTVKAFIYDAFGNPVPNASVTFQINSGTASFAGSSTITTDASGEATAAFTSTVAGDADIIATVNGVAITNNSPATITFIADVPQVTNPLTTLSVVTTGAAANGTATNSVKATLYDANGNPVPNASVVFTIASGTGNFTGSATITTDQNGEAVIDIVSTVVGIVTITATVNGDAITNGSPASVEFVADIPDPTAPTTQLVVVNDNATADGIATNRVKAIVTDAAGNLVENTSVTFHIHSGTGTLVGSATVVTDANGEAYIDITSTVVGNVEIVASIGGVQIVNGSPAEVTFVDNTPDYTSPQTRVEMVKNNAEADGIDVVRVKIYLVNKDGNGVPGETVNFSAANANFQFVPGHGPDVVTDANGEAEVWLVSSVAGTGDVTASIGGVTSIQNNPVLAIFQQPTVTPTHPDTRLEVSIGQALANGTDEVEVFAYVMNTAGNPIVNQVVGFYIISGVADFSGVSYATTDINGRAVIRLHSNVAGQVQIGGIVNGVDIINGKPAQVEFVHNMPDPTHADTYLYVEVGTAAANGLAQNVVRAHVVDQDGNPAANITVTFSILSGTADFAGSAVVQTNANGDAWVYLTSTVVGDVELVASVNGVQIVNGSPAEVEFITEDPGTPGTPVYQLVIIYNNAKADGVAVNRVKAVLRDGHGQPIVNGTVTFNIHSGTGQIVGTGVLQTDANGEAYVDITSTVVGVVSITADYEGTAITMGSPAPVTFTADDPDLDVPTTLIEVVQTGAKADLTDMNAVRVVLTDGAGNPVAGKSVTFTIASGTAQFIGSATLTTNSNGEALIYLISDVVGAVEVTATYEGNAITNGSPATVFFVVPDPDPTAPTTQLVVVNDNATADGIATNRVKAIVTDAGGNVAENASVTFQIHSGTGTLVGSATVVTDANGEAYIDITSTVVGNVEIVASIGGVQIVNGSPAEVTFVDNTPDYTSPQTRVEMVKNNAEADGIDVVRVKIYLVNKDGNGVPGETVNFSAANANFQFVPGHGPDVVTDANGEAEVWLVSSVAGTGDVTASIGGVTSIQNNPVLAIFQQPTVTPTHPDTRLEVSIGQALADGVAEAEVHAYVVNTAGNPIVNQVVGFYIISGVADFSGVSYAFTDINGRAVIRLHSNVAGQVQIGGIVNGVDIINGKPAQVEFVHNMPDPTHADTYLYVEVGTAAANGLAQNVVRAHVVDQDGNPAANITVTFSILSGTADFAGSAVVQTNANGDAWVYLTSTVVGDVELVASVNGVQIVNGSPAEVEFITEDPGTPGTPVYQLVIIYNNAKADGVAVNRVKAVLRDGHGQPIVNGTVTFNIHSGTGTLVLPSTLQTDANGEAYVDITSTVVGVVSITADYEGTAITMGSPAPVTFTADDPDLDVPTTLIEVVQTGAKADLTDMNAVRVVLTDGAGNPVAGESVTFNIANGTAQFIGSATITTNSDGEALIYLISDVVGAVEVTATYEGNAITNGSPAIVHFSENDPDLTHILSALIVVKDGAEADMEDENIIKAVVVDANGDPLSGQPVLFHIDNGTAQPLQPVLVITNSQGEAEWQLISNTVGFVQVSASINGVSFINNNPAQVEFVKASANTEVSSTRLEVVVDSVVADGVAINQVKAVITDKLGAPIENANIEFQIQDGTATMTQNQTGITDASGELVLDLVSQVAGDVYIIATVNGESIIHGSPARVTFVPGAPDFTHDSTYIKKHIDSSKANGIAENMVKVKLVDEFGNVIRDQDVTFYIVSGTATPVNGLVHKTDEFGFAYISLRSTIADEVQLGAQVEGDDVVNGHPATVEFLAAPDVNNPQTRLEVVKGTALADGQDQTVVKAIVYSYAGTPLPNATITFQILQGNGVLAHGGTVVTDVAGEALMQITSTQTGEVLLIAIVEGVQIIHGSPAKVEFVEPEIYMPKVFTPNGDGHNDVLRPYLNGLQELKLFNVYNRVGNLIFSTKNAGEGWDGTYRGQMQPNETYIWLIEGVNMKGEKVVRKGMVTLIR